MPSLTRPGQSYAQLGHRGALEGLRKAIEETEAELGGDASALVKEAKSC